MQNRSVAGIVTMLFSLYNDHEIVYLSIIITCMRNPTFTTRWDVIS